MYMDKCLHIQHVNKNIAARTPKGCEECLKIKDSWVELRVCLTCGHVGCCDSSKHKHAQKHFEETEHPIIAQHPERAWQWCYQDSMYIQ